MFESFKTNLDLPKYCVGTYVEMAYVSVRTVNRDWEYEGKFDAIISEHETCFSVCRISKKTFLKKDIIVWILRKQKCKLKQSWNESKFTERKLFIEV